MVFPPFESKSILSEESARVWRVSSEKTLRLERPLLMGILNATPDSFSDGGEAMTVTQALRKAEKLLKDGADMLDIGGESTRPGASPVTIEEELSRVLPVVRAVRREFPESLLSVDTVHPVVAEAAFGEGVNVLNDVSALETGGDAMAELLQRYHAGCVLMHSHPLALRSPMDALVEYFRERLAWILSHAGLVPEQFVLDPGLGFCKGPSENLLILRQLPRLRILERPLLVGHSRKSFLGQITGRSVQDRDTATAVLSAFSLISGADILRVHAIGPNLDAVKVTCALCPPHATPHSCCTL